MHRVRQHQHLARVYALGTGGDALTASVASVREGRRGAAKWSATAEKIDHAVRDGLGIGILEPGVRNDRAYFHALAACGAGAEHLGGFGVEVACERLRLSDHPETFPVRQRRRGFAGLAAIGFAMAGAAAKL